MPAGSPLLQVRFLRVIDIVGFRAGKAMCNIFRSFVDLGEKMFSHLLLSNWEELQNTSENFAVPENE